MPVHSNLPSLDIASVSGVDGSSGVRSGRSVTFSVQGRAKWCISGLVPRICNDCGNGEQGLPGSLQEGYSDSKTEGTEEAGPTVKIFHAGTALDSDGNLIATGGRVLGVTAKGKDLEEARDRAYQSVEHVNWPGGFFRRDIGWRALTRKQYAARSG